MALDNRLPVPEDHRMPRRNVKFPTADEVSAVTRGAILDSAAFLALDPKTVNEAQPALVSVDGGEVQKGFRHPTGEVVIVAGFDQTVVLPHGNIDVSRATFPMASPNERHFMATSAPSRYCS